MLVGIQRTITVENKLEQIQFNAQVCKKRIEIPIEQYHTISGQIITQHTSYDNTLETLEVESYLDSDEKAMGLEDMYKDAEIYRFCDGKHFYNILFISFLLEQKGQYWLFKGIFSILEIIK